MGTASVIEEVEGEMFAETDDFVGSSSEHRSASHVIASTFS